MKFIVLLLVVASVAAQKSGISTNVQVIEWIERFNSLFIKYKEIKRNCADKLKTTQDEKCLLACELEEWGVLENGKFSLQEIVKLAEYYHKGSVTLPLFKLFSLNCEKKVAESKATDKCDIAAEIGKCFRNEAFREVLKYMGHHH